MIIGLTTSRQPWLTRGRLLVGLPLGIGLVVSAAIGLVVVRPLVQTLQELEERRDTLLSLQRSLPALERQLSQAQVELRVAVEKQALLLGLLAGRNKVQTFLALLNQQALASGVHIQRYEPSKPLRQPRDNLGGITTHQTRSSRQNPRKIHGKHLVIASHRLHWESVVHLADCRLFCNGWKPWRCWLKAVNCSSRLWWKQQMPSLLGPRWLPRNSR